MRELKLRRIFRATPGPQLALPRFGGQVSFDYSSDALPGSRREAMDKLNPAFATLTARRRFSNLRAWPKRFLARKLQVVPAGRAANAQCVRVTQSDNNLNGKLAARQFDEIGSGHSRHAGSQSEPAQTFRQINRTNGI